MPFATYEVKGESISNGCGVGVSINCEKLKTLDVYIKRIDDKVIVMYSVDGKANKITEEEFGYEDNISLVVTSHHGDRLDVFLRYGNYMKIVGFFGIDGFLSLKNETIFKNTTASLYVNFEGAGNVTISDVEMYMDAGMSQADMKPIRYEDGQPIMENGKLFLTMTSRLGFEMYQSVLSWNPSTCVFNLEGILFFDMGDGDWCGNVASSLIYDRNEKNWKIWMASFSHGHILGYAQFENDPRFGINVIDITLFDGYKFVSKSFGDAVTGGMFTLVGGKRYFVCGANFDKRAQYNVYDAKDFTRCTHLKCDFDDGGFRGWGTIIPVPCGTRTKYMWITFDRHNASDYNWSYGTLYVYESDLMNKDYDW